MGKTRRYLNIILIVYIAAIFNLGKLYSVDSRQTYDGKTAVILCFHDINGEGKYSIKQEEFVEILNLVKNKYEVYSLKTWYEKVSNGEKFTRPPLVLTFDDGYDSIFKYVIPTLTKFQFGATFFIYLQKYDNNPDAYVQMGDLPEIFEIGSHSFSHADMEKLYKQNRKQFYKEIFLSRKKLEFLVGKAVISWAWPYGYYNQDMEVMAKKAGYTIQVNTDYKNTHNEMEGSSFSRYTIQNPDPVSQAREILAKNVLR